MPPNATYLFKHALVQDAAYGTLLREPRRALHARIAETLESQFAEIAENQPELLARYCTEAGLIEKSGRLLGQSRTALAGALGPGRSNRAVDARAGTDGDPAQHSFAASRTDQASSRFARKPAEATKGFAAAETKAAVGSGASLIEQAESLGEPAEYRCRCTRFSSASGAANSVAFDGDAAMRELAAQFLALAEKQKRKSSIMIGHRLVGSPCCVLETLRKGGRT